MNGVYCITQDLKQLPTTLDWLTVGERERLDGFRFEKRRRDWLLGRWTGKNALLEFNGLSRRDIRRFEIDSAPSGAPLPRLDGRPCRVGLSLSHSHGRAFAAVSRRTMELGCDIELIEPRGEVFVETYFTVSERAQVADAGRSNRDSLITRIWSAKESTLKALRTGLHADTRSVEVIDDGIFSTEGWGLGRTVVEDAGEFSCRWRRDGDFVLTIAKNQGFNGGQLHL